MWIVVTQYSAYEINYVTFENEELAKADYDKTVGDGIVHCFLAEVKENT